MGTKDSISYSLSISYFSTAFLVRDAWIAAEFYSYWRVILRSRRLDRQQLLSQSWARWGLAVRTTLPPLLGCVPSGAGSCE